MAYDIYTFASYSAYYSDYTKHYVYTLLSASFSTVNAAVDFAQLRIREFFGNRKLFVLFEDKLACDPALDHQAPKDVYPLFKDVVEAELGQLKVFEKTALTAQLEAAIFAVVQEELRMRLQYQKQNEVLETELTVARYNWEASKEVVSQQSAELVSLRKKMQEFQFMYQQQIAKKRAVGKMYRPDFQVGVEPHWQEQGGGTELVVAQLRRQVMILTGENERLQASLSAAMSSLRDLDIYKDQLLAYQSQIAKLNSMLADFNSKYDQATRDYQVRIQVLEDELSRMRAFEKENGALEMQLDQLYKLLTAQTARSQREREDYEAKMSELNDYVRTLRYQQKQWEKDAKAAKLELTDLKERLLYAYQVGRQQKNEDQRQMVLSKGEKGESDEQRKAKQVLLDIAANNYVYRGLIERLTGLQLCLESAEQRKSVAQMLYDGPARAQRDAEAQIGRLQLRPATLSKCHYLFRVQPLLANSATQCVTTEIAGGSDFDPRHQPDLLDSDLVNSLLFENNKQQSRSPAGSAIGANYSADEAGAKERNRSAALLYQREAVSAAYTTEDEALYFDDLPTSPEDFMQKSRRGNQLIAEMDGALVLVDKARNEALQSLDDRYDALSQTAGDSVLTEPARDAKAKRASACADRILRLSRFTLKYQRDREAYDVPEVFQRLYNAAREIKARRDRLREQMDLWEKRYFARRSSVQQQGISVASALHGNSMMRVSSAKADKKEMSLLYELPTREAGNAKSQARSGASGAAAASISDRELMEAVFGQSGAAKEMSFQILLRASQ